MSTTEQQSAPDLPDIEPMPVAVKFASRGKHLTLERVHPRRHVDASGNAVWTTGVDYEFQMGELIVYPGQDLIADRFDPATGEMHEQDVIEWLRSQPMFGHGNGFWEVAPVAPDPAPLMQKIMQLAVAAGNPDTREEAEDRLVRLYETEAESWQRPAVLDACKSALAAIESQHRLSEPVPHDDQYGAGERDLPAPAPPGFSRDEDGVLRVDNPDLVPVSQGAKPTTLGGGFNPDVAPVRED